MKLPRPHASVFAALLLLSGCAHKTAISEPPRAEVVQADTTEPSGKEGAAAAAARAAAEAAAAAAQAAAEDATPPNRPVKEAAGADASPPPAQTSDAPVAAAAQATEAERDFNALYGQQDTYDPIADPTLPPPAEQAVSYDPWEKFNRRMHRFNNAIDRRIAKPLANAYIKVVPRPVRLGVGNFFNNLGQPASAINALLQGKPRQAGYNVGRFLLNTTVGIGGIFDPASAVKIPNRSEDFGQTLGVWGWKKSRFIELPLFGPRTLRDVFGMAGDAPLSPMRRLEDDRVRVFLQGLQLVDLRTQLMSTDSFREGATDDYTLVRDAWIQRRNYQIEGDKSRQNQDALPDYLKSDEDNPTVPIDAMPSPDIRR